MNTLQPLTKKPKLEVNKFLFAVVNEFDLDEFTRYTNFRDVMLTILKGRSNLKDLERFIEQNFLKNIPNKESWRKGGFFSLKLTAGFYESDTATRIFKRIFHMKKCTVKLDRLYVESSSIMNKTNYATSCLEGQTAGYAALKEIETYLDSSNDNDSLKLKVKYPRKIGLPKSENHRGSTSSSSISESSVQSSKSSKDVNVVVNYQQNIKEIAASHRTEGKKENKLIKRSSKQSKVFGAETQKGHFLSSSRNEIHTFEHLRSTTTIQSSHTLSGNDVDTQPKNILEKSPWSTSKFMTVSIPFENVKCHMNTAELIDHFRRSFYGEIQNIEKEFDKYVSSTDPTNLSIKDFWCTLFRSKIGNDKAQTETREIFVNTFNTITNGTELPNKIGEAKIKEEINDEVNESHASDCQVHHGSEKRSVVSIGNKDSATDACSKGFLSLITQQKNVTNIPQPMNIVVESPRNIRSDIAQEVSVLNKKKHSLETDVNFRPNKRRRSAESYVSNCNYQQEYCDFVNSGPRRKTT